MVAIMYMMTIRLGIKFTESTGLDRRFRIFSYH